jgi:hypothetical protein
MGSIHSAMQYIWALARAANAWAVAPERLLVSGREYDRWEGTGVSASKQGIPKDQRCSIPHVSPCYEAIGQVLHAVAPKMEGVYNERSIGSRFSEALTAHGRTRNVERTAVAILIHGFDLLLAMKAAGF